MKVKEFAENLKDIISEKMDCAVQVQEVTKNNGVVLTGLIIREDGINVIPTIYVDQFWEEYEDQEASLGEIAERVVEIYRHGKITNGFNMDFFRDFEKVRDGICYMLVNKEANSKLLKRIPHVEFLDMAICFYYDFYYSTLGSGKILIYNNHMEMWGVTVDELLGLAKENSIVRKPAKTWTMREILREMSSRGCDGEPDLLPDNLDDDMMIISNESRTNGAAVILYGVEKSSNVEKNTLALIQFLSILEVLPFDSSAAMEYGKICAYLQKHGTPIGAMDMLIAAHARAEELVVVTNNVREFERVPGIKIENWAE